MNKLRHRIPAMTTNKSNKNMRKDHRAFELIDNNNNNHNHNHKNHNNERSVHFDLGDECCNDGNDNDHDDSDRTSVSDSYRMTPSSATSGKHSSTSTTSTSSNAASSSLSQHKYRDDDDLMMMDDNASKATHSTTHTITSHETSESLLLEDLQAISDRFGGESSREFSSDQFSSDPNFSRRKSKFTSEVEDKVLRTTQTMETRKKLSMLGLTQLRFSNVGVQGREEQLQQLDAALRRVSSSSTGSTEKNGESLASTSSSSKRELVLIGGKSGTGKSTLANTLQDSISSTNDGTGIFCCGKFDVYSSEEPYSAISSLCCQLCWDLEGLSNAQSMAATTATTASSSTSNNNLDASISKELDGSSSAQPTRNLLESIREGLIETIDATELRLLINVVPDLKGLVNGGRRRGSILPATMVVSGSSASSSSTAIGNSAEAVPQTQTQTPSGKSDQQRVLYAFRKFFRLISKMCTPLVLVLDDLQWADQASLLLLEKLCTDKLISGLLIVTCYRDNEVDEQHPFLQTIQRIQQHQQQQQQETINTNNNNNTNNDNNNNNMVVTRHSDNNLATTRSSHSSSDTVGDGGGRDNYDYYGNDLVITKISIGSLSPTVVNSVVMTLLNIHDEPTKSQPLADLLHRRTQGNAMYLLQFIRMLKEELFLEFNVSSNSWTWDLEQIEKGTAASVNVVETLCQKMNKLDSSVSRILQVAACLGSSFDEMTLYKVWKRSSSSRRRSKALRQQEEIVFSNGGECEEEEEEKQEEMAPGHESTGWSAIMAIQDEESTSIYTANDENENDSIEDEDEANFRGALDGCLREMFLEPAGNMSYRFVHDQISQAAMALIPSDAIAAVQSLVGTTLLEEMMRMEDENDTAVCPSTIIFVAANNLNNANSKDLSVARLNLQASQRAKNLSAFASAAAYASRGIACMGDDPWNRPSAASTRQLALDLYSNAAEAEASAGNPEQAKRYCEIILEQTSLSTESKLRAYMTLMEVMGNTKATLEFCSGVLENLDCKFPGWKLFQILALGKNIKKYKSAPLAEEVFHRPYLTDTSMLMTMKLLDKMCTLAFFANENLLMLLALFRMVAITLEYGRCDYSSAGFCSIGVAFFHFFGKGEVGINFVELGQSMLTKSRSEMEHSRAMFVGNFMGRAWARPLQSVFPHLLEGYKKGMQIGDLESAMNCIQCYLWLRIYSGKSLRKIDLDMAIYAPQFEALADGLSIMRMKTCWQLVQNFMGLSDNPTTLTGDVLDEAGDFEFVTPDVFRIVGINLRVCKKYLCAHFAEYEKGAEIALSHGDELEKESKASPAVMFDTFSRAVCLYAMARTTKKRKYKKEASRLRKVIASWLERGNPNVVHHCKILDAEHAALLLNGSSKKKKSNVVRTEEAITLYQNAIVLAARSGFCQDAALAHERCALTILSMNNGSAAAAKNGDAKYHLEEAIKYYSDWGANRNVARLEQTYSKVLDEPF